MTTTSTGRDPATGSVTGTCAACGDAFTTQPQQIPRRRYCSVRCRKTAWRRRHPKPSRVRPGDIAAPHDAGDVPGAVPRDVPGDVSPDVPPPARPTTRCPHCAQPIAVITLLVTPAAARIPAPEPPRHDR